MITHPIAALGRLGIDLLRSQGKAGLLLYGAIFRVPSIRKGFPLVIQQI